MDCIKHIYKQIEIHLNLKIKSKPQSINIYFARIDCGEYSKTLSNISLDTSTAHINESLYLEILF